MPSDNALYVCQPDTLNYTIFRTECQIDFGVLVLSKRAVFPPNHRGLGFQTVLLLMDSGCIVTASSTCESERLRVRYLRNLWLRRYHLLSTPLLYIYKQITELLHVHVPNCVAIERVFHNRNVSSSLTTAQTIGIIELAAAQGSLDVLMFTPQQVKSSVCGHGGVDKAAVQKFASRLTGVSIKNAHAADSVAVAIAGHLRIH